MSLGSTKRRRGYALPIVVLLAMIGALMAAVMLERQAAQQLSVNRQLARYRVHHAGRGIKETVGAWLNTVQSEPVSTLVGAGGHALDIELDDGRMISVFLAEAQGTVLNQISGLPGPKASAARGVLDRLAAAVGAERLGEFVRQAGPVPVSAVTAPREVLVAAAAGVLGASAAETYADFLIRERSEGKLMAGKLTAAANEAGATDTERKALTDLVTDQPTLYRVTAEVRGAAAQTGQVFIMGQTEVQERFNGLVMIEGKKNVGRGSSNQDALLQPLGAFLTWEEAPVDAALGE
jgi:hypothetical protein